MSTKPAIPFSDPNLILNKRVGIVNHSQYGDSEYIWFSKPRILIAVLAGGVALFFVFSLITYFAVAAREQLSVVAVLYVAFMLIFSLLIYKLGKHNRHIELSNGRLLLIQRDGDTDTILQEITAPLIHSVSTAAASASPRVSMDSQLVTSAPPYALFPSILVCAEPKNVVITGPRRFRHQEVQLILSIINQFRLQKD